jgi:hypothetical protein
MGLKEEILATKPTSYWPLDDDAGAACHDELGLHAATLPTSGVKPAVVPFGPTASAPYFDGEIGSCLTVADDHDGRYSQPLGNALSVAAWICPLTLDNIHTWGDAEEGRYAHFLEKSVHSSMDVEWAMRLYNENPGTNPNLRHSRLSFYTFKPGPNPGKGNGSYMEHGHSRNDPTPVETGKWIFVVGQAEPFEPPDSPSTGDILWKQGIEAERSRADKYAHYGVRPFHGTGSLRIGGTSAMAFKGSIAHVAIWNALISSDQIASIWDAGLSDLRATPMYHSYV